MPRNPHGGRREGAGRPKLPESQKRVMVSLRLRPDLAQWLREQPESQTATMDRLLEEARGKE
jgi:hypothetical protein